MEITRTDLIILALLAEKPSYGWELDATLTARGAQLWAEYSRPHLYYALRKLEKHGYVELLPPQPHELKRLHQITKKGRNALGDTAITDRLLYNRCYFDFDLLLGFPERFRSDKKDFQEVLEGRRQALQQELAAIQEVWREAELAGKISFGRFAVIRHRIKFLKSELDFLKWLAKNTPDNWDSLSRPASG
ncbi:MAG: PadR family transcriptional regulator [candidate division Zixibacteria bacterium]|nr:PadR family transcriptional regulator [candidate division Zixibacteria bacterium]